MEAVKKEKSLDARGQSHYAICGFLLKLAVLILIVRLIATGVNIIYAVFQSPADISMTSTVNGMEIELFWGYVRIKPEFVIENVDILNPKILCIGYQLLVSAAYMIPILLILSLLRRILKTIEEAHSPFVNTIEEYTRKAGKALILFGVFSNLLIKTGTQLLAYHMVSDIDFLGDMQFSWIFAGAIVLLISDIFRKGCELQQFSDETL